MRPRKSPSWTPSRDEQLFAPWFRRGEWSAWFAFLAALFALPMSGEQLALYRRCTGREQPPRQRCAEAWLVCGRRAGKSFVLALVAVFLACFQGLSVVPLARRARHDPGHRDRQAAGARHPWLHPRIADARADAGAHDREGGDRELRPGQLGDDRGGDRELPHRSRIHHSRRASR